MTEQVQEFQWPPGTDFDEVPVRLMDIGNRAYRVLKRQGIRTYAQLLDCEEKDLTDFRGFGPICLAQVMDALAREGLKLKEPDYSARR